MHFSYLFCYNMNLLVWNCQGAASKETNLILKEMLTKFRPSILGLLEPRVSGSHADDICKRMGYENWLGLKQWDLAVEYGYFGNMIYSWRLCTPTRSLFC